jgi:phosphoribosylglycinamide formyltransferase-1
MYQPDLIVLAGFLLKIPSAFIEKFDKKIINLHPALLPQFGGKGMYGMRVHEAVIAAKEKESGITIHHVNEQYDEGNILFQEKVLIDNHETSESLAEKIHELEYKHLPHFIEKYLNREKAGTL